MPIADLRKEYTQATLSKDDALPNPFDFFQVWFDHALKAELSEPNAMTLATVNDKGLPAARIVLLKGVDTNGFVFFTNYESRKGQELSANPHAALLFHWVELERQVRIEGHVERISAEQSDEYFHSRPLGSQMGAWASPQSQEIESREVLENRLIAIEAKNDKNLERPAFWGGYKLVPNYFEFWQGRSSRLHDRLAYKREGTIWEVVRLAP